jgi:hypothetical protein
VFTRHDSGRPVATFTSALSASRSNRNWSAHRWDVANGAWPSERTLLPSAHGIPELWNFELDL